MTGLKNVSVFRNGHKLKSFSCARAEIAGESIIFHGVPAKKGGTLSVYYAGGIWYDVDYTHHSAVVRPELYPDIEIVVTW
jgi:hypothetical protein